MSLLIKNGTIVTDAEQRRADVLCEGEKIARIDQNLTAPPGTTIIDASGKLLFPGFVDPHVHAYLPLKSTCSKDTYETVSRAALVGGTTCFIDFCSPEREQLPSDALKIWDAQSVGRCACDYSYHMAVTRFDDEVASQLREVVERGIRSFKIYLAYKDSVGISLETLDRVMDFSRNHGVLVLGHCEDSDRIELLQKKLIAEGRTGPEWHYHSRPPEIEALGTKRFLASAKKAGANAYVVHLSCAEALREAQQAGTLGKSAWVETLVSYLLLDRTYAERPDFEGAKYVVSPPLRDQSNHDILWRALADGIISTVATDHAPFDFKGQKSLGRNDFRMIPGGMPTVENRINLLFTRGVKAGRIGLNRFVEVASTAPAKLFGMYPRKGAIRVGSDADLVVFDPNRKWTITAANHLMNVDYDPFEGWEMIGKADVVTVRGQVAVRGGQFVGDRARGRFVKRGPLQAV